jgi:hypothetical protein
MTTATIAAVPPCPSCGADRVNVAQPDATPLFECRKCGEIESPLVGIVPPDEDLSEPAQADELAEPPDEDLLPPPEDEQDPEPESEPQRGLDPATEAKVAEALMEMDAVAPLRALVEILPADFPLPSLIKFTPDTRIRLAADEEAAKLLAMAVTDETSMRVVEACVDRQRTHKTTIEALFEEPCSIANRLHKHLTGLRAEWLWQTVEAIEKGNSRILEQQRKLEREAAEKRRRDQEEADRVAREQARREAEAAEKAQAPPAVVEQLRFEAETATAPPVQTSAPASSLRSSSVVPKWKTRCTSTDTASENLQPAVANMTPAELADVKKAMKGVLERRVPITVFEINWSVLDRRASADKKTFAIDGFVAEDLGGLRAKPGRRK